jgi:hypothetical protein
VWINTQNFINSNYGPALWGFSVYVDTQWAMVGAPGYSEFFFVP